MICILDKFLYGPWLSFHGAPGSLVEKVSKKKAPLLFPFLYYGEGKICVNVNLYLTNRALVVETYAHLIAYYKCFHEVINENPGPPPPTKKKDKNPKVSIGVKYIHGGVRTYWLTK